MFEYVKKLFFSLYIILIKSVYFRKCGKLLDINMICKGYDSCYELW